MNECVIHFLWDMLFSNQEDICAIIHPTFPHPRNPQDVRVGPVFNI